jgi:thioredoxin reductase
VAADFVLALIGYEQDDTLFRLAGVALSGDCRAPLIDERTMRSSVPNVYVIGTAVGARRRSTPCSSRTATCTWPASSRRSPDVSACRRAAPVPVGAPES